MLVIADTRGQSARGTGEREEDLLGGGEGHVGEEALVGAQEGDQLLHPLRQHLPARTRTHAQEQHAHAHTRTARSSVRTGRREAEGRGAGGGGGGREEEECRSGGRGVQRRTSAEE
eukprot:3014187-Rhodomonas_salina.1